MFPLIPKFLANCDMLNSVVNVNLRVYSLLEEMSISRLVHV